MLLLAAMAYVRRPHAPVPAGDTSPTAPPPPTTGPAVPVTVDAAVPPVAAGVIPSAMAVSVTGHKVLFKDQCRSVTEPPAPLPAAAAPPVARVSEVVAAAPGGSHIPLAVAVAVAPSSAQTRPPRDP
jgi:hypothetical protein